MKETQRRIQAYKAALPDLKERVLAVALLLVMSVAMLTSASFAWLTISRAPEVKGVNTTVAANGNLEIALASGDGTQAPAESQVGDSNLPILERNLTWGNLINLSDDAYGLENLTLRPARLNTSSLLTSPLYGAVYDGDGRIEKLTSNFGYAAWTTEQGGYFAISENHGVRAISSTKIEAVGAVAAYHNMVDDAEAKNLNAKNTYKSIADNSDYMGALATLMGTYMTARMNSDDAGLSNPSCSVEDIQYIRDMYIDFLKAYDAEAEAMAATLNLQLFLAKGANNYTPYTAADIYALTNAKLKATVVTKEDGTPVTLKLTNLDQFLKDRNTLSSDLEKLETICSNGGDILWKDSGMNGIVNNLVNVGACTIDGTAISSIGASNAMGYLSGTHEAVITNGILKRFEERCGENIYVKNLSISAKIKRSGITVPGTVKANISTDASRTTNDFTTDLAYTKGLNTGEYAGGTAIAKDTYGLALDLWVRTNAQNSYLTLEGNILTETETVRATGKDTNGNEVELYTITKTEEVEQEQEDGTTTTEKVTYSYDLYQIVGEDDSVTWYRADTHAVMTEEEMGDSTPTAKMEEIQTVIGYEGENRVWGDNQLLSTDSTTQGSGSCYVYYADTPEDQARSLELLDSMNVAFVDAKGNLMATAYMDTEHFYAVNGRVTVPLVLRGDSINLGEDINGNVQYAITSLEQNVATRVTALVYLDGTKLTNEDVLAAADIQGQLNIQFGSSVDLTAARDETLENAERRVSASVTKTSFDYDTATEAMTTTVTVNVDGDQPSTVTAFFMRAISDTQGSRQETMTFTKQADGTWKADHEFKVPGTYVLRTVRLDGVDYDLATYPTVTVSGFALESLTWTASANNTCTVMTAEESHTVQTTLKFATDNADKLPKTVQGRFLREDGTAVNINYTLNPTTQVWSGSATFLSSGEYTLQYLVLDDEYMELPDTLWKTANLYLGMKVAVYTTSPQSFKFLPNEMTDAMKNLRMQVTIMDDSGEELPGLQNAKLYYAMQGSIINGMDADLTWNGTTGYYEGTLPVVGDEGSGAGVFVFSRVTVDTAGNAVSTLTKATTSPTFTIIPPEPPEYSSHNTAEDQFAANNDATMNISAYYAQAATVQATIRNTKTGTTHSVIGTRGTSTTAENGKPLTEFSFLVPNNSTGTQDGYWQIDEIRIWDAYNAEGDPYTEEAPLVISLADENIVTRVVSTINVTFAEGQNKDFGKAADGSVTGKFMDTHTLSGLSVSIADFEGKAIAGVGNVQLTYNYKGDSQTYGGYTGDTLNATDGFLTVKFAASGDGVLFTQSENATLQYAGSYTPGTFSFTITDRGLSYTYSGDKLPANTPRFTVSSITPSVAITAISPTGTFDVDKSGAGSGHASATVPTWTATNATVYFKCSRSGEGSTCSPYRHNYSQPSVTLTVSNIGNASQAEMSFGSDVHIYNGSTQVTGYSWTGNGTCARNIGYYRSRTASTDDKTAAGTLTSSALTLTYNGVAYTVAVPTITISNPY